MADSAAPGTARADASIASLRTTKNIALALSLITFGGLAYSFAASMEPYYQVAAGLACYVAYMWHRSLVRRLTEAGAPK